MCFHGRTISRCKMYMLPWFYPSFNLGVFFLTESFLWTHHFDSPRSSFHSSLRLRIVDRSNRFDIREATSAHSFPVEPEAMVSSPPPAKQPTKFVHVKFRLSTQDKTAGKCSTFVALPLHSLCWAQPKWWKTCTIRCGSPLPEKDF